MIAKIKNNYIYLGIIALSLIALIIGTTQANTDKIKTIPIEQWNKTFGEKDKNDFANSVQQTSDGGYIIAGFTESLGYARAWLIKTDADGNMQWDKVLPELNAEIVQQTSDGGYIIVGFRQLILGNLGGPQGWLLKTDVTGNEQWYKTFLEFTSGNSLQQTSDGGYVLAGNKDKWQSRRGTPEFTDDDAWLIKIDVNGNKQWEKTFGGKGDDRAYSVLQTSDGGYLIAGSTNSYGVGEDNAWLIKTDAKGNELWNKTFGENHYDIFRSVQRTSDGGYILAGGSNGDGWLIKTDANWNKQWDRTFPVKGSLDSVQVTSDGGYILISDNGLLLKTDAEGNKQWNLTNPRGGIESVQETSDSGYIVVAYVSDSKILTKDVWLVKIAIIEGSTQTSILGSTESKTQKVNPMKNIAGFESSWIAVALLVIYSFMRNRK